MIINPCNCGGLPYPCDYIDKYETLYTIRCMKCGNVGLLEPTESDALIKWNQNNSFKIDEAFIQEKYMIHCQMEQVRNKLNIKPITLNGIVQR